MVFQNFQQALAVLVPQMRLVDGESVEFWVEDFFQPQMVNKYRITLQDKGMEEMFPITEVFDNQWKTIGEWSEVRAVIYLVRRARQEGFWLPKSS